MQHEKSLATATGSSSILPGESESSQAVSVNPDNLSFKHNRMYRHNILRINYTTYNVRRAQDTINPRTSHCDAIFLAENSEPSDPSDPDSHPFIYGRIIGVYHVNVVYSGPGTLDYKPRRVEFLWVRWYDRLEPPGSWASCALDRLCFPPISRDGAFDFVNPADVVRGCHIIPRFTLGLQRPPDQIFPNPAMRRVKARKERERDADDWKEYYVNRYLNSFIII